MKNILAVFFILAALVACKEKEGEKESETATSMEAETMTESKPLKISLAQWSLHTKYEAEGSNPFEFAKDAKNLGIDAIEYVSQLYEKQIEDLGFEAVIDSLKTQNELHGVSCVLIMVDHEGDLADPDDEKRNLAVENHKKWVDATNLLGGHAIRVNAFGTNDPEIWRETLKDGLTKLSAYAATKGINVLVENHGWLSSDADLLMEVLNDINMDNCGTLPDFGNWCIKRKDGERWGECEEEYPDYYKGLELMMPRAKAVSAKSYNFDENGNETKIDYARMMSIVKENGYTGYIGIEYEGKEMDEVSGIKATKALLEKANE